MKNKPIIRKAIKQTRLEATIPGKSTLKLVPFGQKVGSPPSGEPWFRYVNLLAASQSRPRLRFVATEQLPTPPNSSARDAGNLAGDVETSRSQSRISKNATQIPPYKRP